MIQILTLRFELEKDIPNLKHLAAQRCWSIQGVAKCDPVEVPEFAVTGDPLNGYRAVSSLDVPETGVRAAVDPYEQIQTEVRKFFRRD